MATPQDVGVGVQRCRTQADGSTSSGQLTPLAQGCLGVLGSEEGKEHRRAGKEHMWESRAMCFLWDESLKTTQAS